MGKNIKRLSLALVALGLSAPVFADNCSPFAVTVPNQQGGFTAAADALYLRPSAANLSYNAQIGNITLNPATIPVTINNVNPSYNWGFDVMAGYRIPCTGNDITLAWTHLGETSDSDSVSRAIGTTGFNFNASSNVQFKYNAVDLDVGQRVNFGDYFNFRLFTGLRWADLQQNSDNFYSVTRNTNGTTLTSLGIDQESEFKGVGPQVGLEGRYCLGYGFGLDANATFSAVIGHVDATTDTAFRLNPVEGAPVAVNVNFDQEKKNRVVPALDTNLGVDYTYNFNNAYRSSLVVQAGWKVINYWDVTHALINNVGPNNASSVAFDGPYAGIKVNV